MFVYASAALIATSGVNAQENGDGKDDEKEEKSLSDFVSDFERSDGLFPLYRDPETGEVYLEIDADQFGKEYIYFSYVENGPPETGHFRGNYRDNRIIQFNRRFNRVEVEAINTNYYLDPENDIVRAADANVSRAPLGNVEIVAKSKDNDRVLISADALLDGEALQQIRPWQPADAKPGSSFALGELSDDKTHIEEFSNFPENTDIRVEYVYDSAAPLNYGGAAITDPRSVAILVQHSFLEMPEPGFEPRVDDFRVGYFTNQVTDLTSASYTPYRDMINRWRLVKKNPDAPISDPVKPITFWIENTTPQNLRSTIRDAALAWNVAFEAAGFSNAVEVKMQPDDAEWEAGDIRYNVLRWTSSPTPPFGGYGPSFVNPRTGEIIGADIMLEYVFLTNRRRLAEIYAIPDASNELNELVRQDLYYLILHEIGHTLGLNHNMRSSNSVPLASLGDASVPPTNSVMDYPAVNIALPGAPQGQYAVASPGAYDLWAIQFGYTPDDDSLDAILARSTEPALAFGNDADDVRSPGTHIDPRVMVNDLSDDPISWAASQAMMIDQMYAVLPDRVLETGGTYEALSDSYSILSGQRRNAAVVASRWIAGVFNNRSVIGQAGAETPFVPVPAAEQRRALAVVNQIAFRPDAFAASESLLNRLQVQRRGFDSGGTNVDPQPHSSALAMQRSLLDHMMHPNVLTRLTDTRRYGGDYPVSTYMRELTDVMFDADRNTAVNTYRQNLQIEYVTRLIAAASGAGGGVQQTPNGPQPLPNFDYVARSAALASLATVKSIAQAPIADPETKAHRMHLLNLIEEFERR